MRECAWACDQAARQGALPSSRSPTVGKKTRVWCGGGVGRCGARHLVSMASEPRDQSNVMACRAMLFIVNHRGHAAPSLMSTRVDCDCKPRGGTLSWDTLLLQVQLTAVRSTELCSQSLALGATRGGGAGGYSRRACKRGRASCGSPLVSAHACRYRHLAALAWRFVGAQLHAGVRRGGRFLALVMYTRH